MKKLPGADTEEGQDALQDKVFTTWYSLKAMELQIALKLVGDGEHDPVLPGAVQYALPGGDEDGWVRNVFVKYDGKFWALSKYAEQADPELRKLQSVGLVTRKQKERARKKAEAIRKSAAARAAKDIKNGTCATWSGDPAKLMENYWIFPTDDE